MFAFHCPFGFAFALALHFHSLHQEIMRKIAMSNEKSKQSANLHCSHRDFQVDDLLMIRLHVRSLEPSKVLNNIRPNACVLDISINLEIRTTFHVETLVPYHSYSIPNRESFAVTQTLIFWSPQPMPFLPSVTNCKEEIEIIVEDQISSIRRGGYQKYLVKWKDRPKIDSDVL